MGCSGSKSQKTLQKKPTSRVVAVVGASGSVGSAVVRALASTSGVEIRVGVRDPSSVVAQELATLGPNIKVSAASMGLPETLQPLFRGADAVFINSPGDIDRVTLTRAAIDAARAVGVPHIVVVSVFTADRTKTVFGRQFRAIEDAVLASSSASGAGAGASADAGGEPAPIAKMSHTIVRLPFFMDNLLGQAATAKSQSKIYGPAAPDSLFSSASTAEIGEACARILLRPAQWANTRLRFGSRPFSHADVARAITSVRDPSAPAVEYVRVPKAAAKATFLSYGMPEWQVDGALELFDQMDAREPAMVCESEDLRDALGREPLGMQCFIQNNAGGFRGQS